VPLMVGGQRQGVPIANGVHSQSLAEAVDLLPTLLDAAGFGQLPLCGSADSNDTLCREGVSLLPLAVRK